MYFYFDESGSPAILGHHGKNLLATGSTTKTFSVGYVEIENPHEISVQLEKLRQELLSDEYLKAIPSIKNENNFREWFNMNTKRLYKFLVSEVLKNRVHLYREIDIYFSAMDGIVSQNNMMDVLKDATNKF